MNANLLSLLKLLTREELLEVEEWSRNKAHDLDPEVISDRAQQAAYWAEREREGKIKEAHNKKVLKVLKKVLVPGTVLKMNGCKDGTGLREFIRWDEHDNLVCWQIQRSRQWKKTGMGDKGEFIYVETKTNQVTTHMPDKVARVVIDCYSTPIKNLL